MSLAATVREWFVDENSLIYECRHCGTSLAATDQTCSTCGSAEIVEFNVS